MKLVKTLHVMEGRMMRFEAPSRVHRYFFNTMGINVSEQDFGSSLNYVNEFFNALTATLTFPVLLI